MANIPKVQEDWSESDLTHRWFTKILSKADPSQKLTERWEKKNQNGRKDLSLSFGERERCIVEFKRPSVHDLRQHLVQAHRYGHSSNYWRNGSLVPILGVLTNGYEAIVFDCSCSFNESAKTAVTFSLTTEMGLARFEKIFRKLAAGNLGHDLHRPPIEDSREKAKDVVSNLSDELLKYYRSFQSAEVSRPFDATLQMFLVAVLRDCGYIPTRTLQLHYDSGNWNKVSELLNEMLASNFERLPNGKHGVVEKVYQETRTLCARLDRVPADCLGMVYEAVLHKISGSKATTSYYTPYEVAQNVLKVLKPTPDETYLDPSCGSGTFLTAAIEYVTSHGKKNRDPGVLFSYVKNKLRGIDRDIYACQVAKAMVLAAVASQLDFDPSQRDLKLPTLEKTIIHDDLFLYDPPTKFDVIAGNLPWGHVDGKRKDDVLDPVTRKKMGPLSEYESYYRNVDISSLALEQLNALFLKGRGRLGLLIKQQTLHARGSENFRSYAKREGMKFWDYGHLQLFNNKASLTAIAWIGIDQKEFIKQMYEEPVSMAEDGVLISTYGKFFMGFQSSSNHVYENWAARNPTSDLIRMVYPSVHESKNFVLPKLNRKIAFIPAGHKAPKSFVDDLSSLEKKNLSSRAQVADGFPFSWRGSEGYEHYQFNGKQRRIVFAGNFTYGSRMYAMLDSTGKGIGLTSHTIFVPNKDTSDEVVYAILGWLNSTHLVNELERVKVTKLSPGFGVYPKNMDKVKIPQELLVRSFANFVKGYLTGDASDLNALDRQIETLANPKRTSKKLA